MSIFFSPIATKPSNKYTMNIYIFLFFLTFAIFSRYTDYLQAGLFAHHSYISGPSVRSYYNKLTQNSFSSISFCERYGFTQYSYLNRILTCSECFLDMFLKFATVFG